MPSFTSRSCRIDAVDFNTSIMMTAPLEDTAAEIYLPFDIIAGLPQVQRTESSAFAIPPRQAESQTYIAFCQKANMFITTFEDMITYQVVTALSIHPGVPRPLGIFD